MDKAKLLEDLQAIYAQLLATPKSPLTASIKQEVENCHRRLAKKEQSEIAWLVSLMSFGTRLAVWSTARYQAKLPEQVADLFKPLGNQTFQILTKESIVRSIFTQV